MGENCFWIDGAWSCRRICHRQYRNPLHYNHQGRNKMFAAMKDVWIPLKHRILAATAKYCKSCLKAGKNLKPDIPKSDMGKTYVPREPSPIGLLRSSYLCTGSKEKRSSGVGYVFTLAVGIRLFKSQIQKHV